MFNIFYLSIITFFLTTSFYTILPNLLKSTGVVSSFLMFNLSTLPFKFLKLIGRFFSSSKSNLSISDFKLTYSALLEEYDVSIHVLFLNIVFVA